MTRSNLRAWFAGMLVLGATAPVLAVPGNPLGDHLWKNRIVLVSAPSRDDAGLSAQRQIFARMGDAARERDLVLVEAVGDGERERAMRRRFGLPADRFAAVLIGKDGGPKLASATPLSAEQLLPTIDAMPMRRREMRRR